LLTGVALKKDMDVTSPEVSAAGQDGNTKEDDELVSFKL
jgi:hypothetical protein